MSKDKTPEPTQAEEIAATVAAALTADTEPTNPISALFDAPHFTPREIPRRYPNRDGSETIYLADVAIPYLAINAVATGAIKLERPANRKLTPVVVFTFKAGVLKPLDDAANESLTDYRRWVAEQYANHQNGKPVSVTNRAGVKMDLTGVDFGDDEEEEEPVRKTTNARK